MAMPSILALRVKQLQSDEPKAALTRGSYTWQVLEEICRRNNIDERHLQPLAAQLEFSRSIYDLRTINRAKKLNNKQIKKRLGTLQKHAEKLKNGLKDLHPQIARECITSHREISEKFMSEQGGAINPSRFEEFHELSAMLETILQTAANQVTPASAGKPTDDALYVWVKTVSEFWIKILERNYTLDTHEQEPVTEAGRFLVDCMKPLDPSAIPRIAHQMRRFLEEEKPHSR